MVCDFYGIVNVHTRVRGVFITTFERKFKNIDRPKCYSASKILNIWNPKPWAKFISVSENRKIALLYRIAFSVSRARLHAQMHYSVLAVSKTRFVVLFRFNILLFRYYVYSKCLLFTFAILLKDWQWHVNSNYFRQIASRRIQSAIFTWLCDCKNYHCLPVV
jgi:hypothetical protein